jgi:titin
MINKNKFNFDIHTILNDEFLFRFVNGKAVKTGHRFRTTHDFGYVALDILYSYSEDSGTYMCKATNLAGEAVNTCTIKVGCK